MLFTFGRLPGLAPGPPGPGRWCALGLPLVPRAGLDDETELLRCPIALTVGDLHREGERPGGCRRAGELVVVVGGASVDTSDSPGGNCPEATDQV
jgi:hypothetical protein